MIRHYGIREVCKQSENNFGQFNNFQLNKKHLHFASELWTFRASLKRLIFHFSLSNHLKNNRIEIGYGVLQNYAGRGFASKAIRLVVKNAFEKWGIDTLWGNVHQKNNASQKVLLKNGFEAVGTFKAEDGSTWIRFVRK